jgi:hypothetical protein
MSKYTAEEAKEFGRQHARNGLKLTPFDCRIFDEDIISATRGLDSTFRMRNYNELRGAFNAGWNEEYIKMVFTTA